MDHSKTLIVSAAIITRPPGEILLARRPDKGPLAGRWEFPGGKAEPGEDPRDALVRECIEELGCRIEVGAIYETIFHRHGARSILLLFYLARVIEGEPASMEENELAWCTPGAMGQYDLLEADRPLIARFIEKFPHFEPGIAKG
jgi:8-oxo-dGTP diphosphatase